MFAAGNVAGRNPSSGPPFERRLVAFFTGEANKRLFVMILISGENGGASKRLRSLWTICKLNLSKMQSPSCVSFKGCLPATRSPGRFVAYVFEGNNKYLNER